MTVTANGGNQAKAEILRRLGHEFTGTIASCLDERMIETEEDSDQARDVYTHPLLPGIRVVVDWDAL